jgi:6-phosphogluconolactonase
MTQLTTLADAEAASRRAAAEIVRAVHRARRERGAAHLALSGGSTPVRTHELLASELAGLADIEIWFADERCVGPEDAQSNYRLALETLLRPAGVPPERVHRIEAELGPEEGAQRYAHALREHAPLDARPPSTAAGAARAARGGLPVLDMIMLGIGPDGHVASLFPGAATLDADDETLCLGVRDAPKPPPERITLSLAVLHAARRCLLLATGASKADAVSAMLREPSPHVPASLLRRERLTVILDDAASPAPLRRSP